MPRMSLWSRRTVLNVAGSVVSVLVAVAAVLFALLADKGHHSAVSSAGQPSTAAGGASSYVPPLVGPSLTDTVVSSTTSPAATSDTASSGTASSGPATSSSGTARGALSEDLARQAVVAYLNAVNARNRVQAGGLICQSLLPTWLENVDTANSDFNYTITNARFTGSAPLGGGTLFLHYTLEFNDHTSNDVDFTVINENGPKICGEQKA